MIYKVPYQFDRSLCLNDNAESRCQRRFALSSVGHHRGGVTRKGGVAGGRSLSIVSNEEGDHFALEKHEVFMLPVSNKRSEQAWEFERRVRSHL